MYPVILEIGPVTIYGYGLMMGIGIIAGFLLASRFAYQVGISSDATHNLVYILVISSFIGARIFYIFTEADYFFSNPLEIFMIWKGGLVFYGAPLGALFGIYFGSKWNKVDSYDVLDVGIIGLSFGHIFGRIGCFLGGCCYGKPTDSIFGVVFTNPDSPAPVDVHIHPTQLYDAFNEFVILWILIFFWNRRSFKGEIALLWATFYSIGRFIVEIFRGDKIRGIWFSGSISTSQIVALIVLAFCIAIFFRNRKVLLSGKFIDNQAIAASAVASQESPKRLKGKSSSSSKGKLKK